MKIKENIYTYYGIWFIISAILTTVMVLFIEPQVGVADQGDFDRIMGISGLDLIDSDKNNPDFPRFYEYIIPEYKITNIDDSVNKANTCSLSYLITFINAICKMLGQTIFKTQYLAVIYCLIYIFAFSIILKALNIKNKIKYIIVSLLILFIFFDGNYLIWFNSLYGEPMMIVTLLAFIAAVLNYIYYKYTVKKTKGTMLNIVFILLTAFLFLGSKLQVFTSLPVIMLLIIKIVWDNKNSLNKISLAILCISFSALISYPVGISMTSNNLSKDTQYNSVFYGVLNNSNTPKEDLIDLGLNPDMSAEAGKHAYLNSSEYEKYIPRSEITNEEFYSKMSNSKLAKFYLTHPIRLLKGMEYTAEKAFYTSTSLGKYTQSDSETPVTEFHRFTLWSFFRENIIPKNLYFIILVYLLIIGFSIYKYFINKPSIEVKNKIILLWTVMLIGVIQFPMPFVGNGMADTAKQLFLFNFNFDGLLLLVISHILLKIISLIKFKLNP